MIGGWQRRKIRFSPFLDYWKRRYGWRKAKLEEESIFPTQFEAGESPVIRGSIQAVRGSRFGFFLRLDSFFQPLRFSLPEVKFLLDYE